MKSILIVSDYNSEINKAIVDLTARGYVAFTIAYDDINEEDRLGSFLWIIAVSPAKKQLSILHKLKDCCKKFFIVDPAKLDYEDLTNIKDTNVTILASWEAFFTHNFL